MEFEIQSGQRAGKTHKHWQYVLDSAREHLLTTGQPCKTLVVGFFPGLPEVLVSITFEVVKQQTPEPVQFIKDDASQF